MRSFVAVAKVAMLMAGVTLLSGCLPSTRAPERLYPVAYEMDLMRSSQDELIRRYYELFYSSPIQAKTIRNEIIAQRMYAVDVQYTIYETALTREGQEVGFGALTTAEGLSTAATLVTPAATKSILSAAATGVLAVKGHYESEILLAQTMRTIQKQMRASRNVIATNISTRMNLSVADYPLTVAMSDVEEYFSAGTVTSGVIDSSTTVGIREADTKTIKQDVNQAPADKRAVILEAATADSGPVRVVAATNTGGTTRPAAPAVVRPTPGTVTSLEACSGPGDAASLIQFLCPNGSLRRTRKTQLVALQGELINALATDPNLTANPDMQKKLITTAGNLSSRLEVIIFRDSDANSVLRKKLAVLLDLALKQGLQPAD